ncbi:MULTISPECIES: DUF4870 domain-containing protein [Staphylococcus]|jgi:uncharacterized Tic20 family protein|uniref:DUF4870 domain-containing protein n=1 Tax=Staphylococcus lugdunensis TaxID=28035 RepID=A0ABX6BSQ0_STALU|nr:MULTISPECIES: DUF4870 domain-containing protein [Staphylococcus]ADC86876.1 Hypothetical protein SLGD_00728 [Staphylococcus lugdunensis HKU09-01]AMG63768.1 DUF4870 domain-containing protein [Staphylococcus lugdunensis]ARB77163.1 DUF4870 domain-containing protein [Staphylococcus lugdunensis]ARJ08613.1 hypothetical protein B7454_04155 [Staphylococcus lugdunensis]ARJ15694.1 hypothetical protein B6N54_03400 [Staphylococcus lugdunensis]
MTQQSQGFNTPQHNDSDDVRLMAMLIYLLGFVSGFIGPLIIWLVKKDDSKLIDQSGKSYLNMFISYMIWCAVPVVIMMFSLIFYMPFDPTSGLISIFIFLLLNLVILGLLITFSVFNIIGCVKYYQGTYYQAPLSIRFFK